MRSLSSRIALVSCGALLLSALGAPASLGQDDRRPPPPQQPQQPPGRPGPGDRGPASPEKREEVRRRIEALRMARLTQELDLDASEAARLFPILHADDVRLVKLADERMRAMRDLRDAGDEARRAAAVDAIIANEKARAEVAVAQLEAVRAVLSTDKMARFLLFQERFHEEVRELLDGARGAPPRGPRPPGGVGPDEGRGFPGGPEGPPPLPPGPPPPPRGRPGEDPPEFDGPYGPPPRR